MTQSLDVHFLQSSAWADFQKSLGRKVFIASGKGWQYLAILESGKMGKRLYCPYGPTAKDVTALAEALKSLRQVAKTHNCDLVRVEPTGSLNQLALKKLKLVKAKRNIQPAHTWCIDLSASPDELIANMSATNRNLHNNFRKKGLKFTESNNPKDIDKLLKILHEVSQHNGIKQHSDMYFKKQAEILLPKGSASLYFAWIDNKCIASSLVYDSQTTRYYAYAGASFAHRKLSAGSPLESAMVLDAKKAGLKTFDLYGVAPDENPNHSWAGFTKFKKSFGGTQKDYLGTWELPLKPLKYKIYHKLQRAKI